VSVAPAVSMFVAAFILLNAIVGVVTYITLLERKFAARMQSRIGPYRVGPHGLLQPIADALKLMMKEDIVPTAADRRIYNFHPGPLHHGRKLAGGKKRIQFPGDFVVDDHDGVRGLRHIAAQRGHRQRALQTRSSLPIPIVMGGEFMNKAISVRSDPNVLLNAHGTEGSTHNGNDFGDFLLLRCLCEGNR